jgi:uncharacterized membrane protein
LAWEKEFVMEIQRNRKTLLIVAMVAGLLTPVTAQASPAQDCREIALPSPGTNSTVNGGDPTGRYLVGDVSYPDRRAGALWRNGRFSEIDDSSLTKIQMFYHDVNSRGVVVGERMTDYSSFHTDAFTYRDGRFTLLPALVAGDDTQALAINSRGDVVGVSALTPVVWPANRPGTVRAVTMPDGQPANGRVLDIDDDGTMVGYLAPYPPGTPYVWPADGRPHPLAIPAGSIGGTANAIRLGMVAGNVFDGDSTVPALWNLRTGKLTLYKNTDAGGAFSVNSRGTLGAFGALVHKGGRVVATSAGAPVTVVTDSGAAAGTLPGDQAVRWVGC